MKNVGASSSPNSMFKKSLREDVGVVPVSTTQNAGYSAPSGKLLNMKKQFKPLSI